MKNKTWKIGEYAKGGVITVNIQGKVLTIIGKDWDFSAGSRRSSNQSNAKEFTRGTNTFEDSNWERKAFMYLTDLTTSYYADQIIKWIKTNMPKHETV